MITLPNDELSEEENFNAISLASPLSIPRNQGVNGHNFAAVKAPEPGVGQQMVKMGQQRAMNSALDFGQTGITSALAPSAPVVASSVEGGAVLGPMAGGGGAALGVPHVAAALAADELLGLGIRKKVVGFDEGGQVGPLNAQYHAGGTKSYDATEEDYRYQMPGSLEYEARMAKNRVKQARRASAPVMKNEDGSIDQRYYNHQEALRQLQKQQDFVYPQMIPDNGKKMGALRMAYTDDPIAAKMYDVGNAPIDTSIMPMGFIGHPTDKNGYTARGYSTGGPISYNAQGTMSEEQARALMNNQPEPMPQPPRRRPMAEELFDEIKAEQNYVSSESLSPPGFSEELAKYMQSIGQPFGGRQ